VELLKNQILIADDWVLLSIILIGYLILFTKIIDPIQFNFFVDPFRHNLYLQRYLIDRNFKVFDKFYLTANFSILVSISLFISIWKKYTFNEPFLFMDFFRILSFLSIFGLIRNIANFFLLKVVNMRKILNKYWFKSVIFNGYSSVFFIIIITTLELNNLHKYGTIKYLFICFLATLIFFNSFSLYELIKDSIKNFIYLFSYICAFKILPWVLVTNYFF